jgi:hypothetical protein
VIILINFPVTQIIYELIFIIYASSLDFLFLLSSVGETVPGILFEELEMELEREVEEDVEVEVVRCVDGAGMADGGNEFIV